MSILTSVYKRTKNECRLSASDGSLLPPPQKKKKKKKKHTQNVGEISRPTDAITFEDIYLHMANNLCTWQITSFDSSVCSNYCLLNTYSQSYLYNSCNIAVTDVSRDGDRPSHRSSIRENFVGRG